MSQNLTPIRVGYIVRLTFIMNDVIHAILIIFFNYIIRHNKLLNFQVKLGDI